MLISTGMYIRRSLGKLLRTVAKSPRMIKLRRLLEQTPFIYQCSEQLPPLSLLIFSVYLGCNIYSFFLDLAVAVMTMWILAGNQL